MEARLYSIDGSGAIGRARAKPRGVAMPHRFMWECESIRGRRIVKRGKREMRSQPGSTRRLNPTICCGRNIPRWRGPGKQAPDTETETIGPRRRAYGRIRRNVVSRFTK
ncbi:hypothetical protein BGC_38780 [Burkholderia sp. 3C]